METMGGSGNPCSCVQDVWRYWLTAKSGFKACSASGIHTGSSSETAPWILSTFECPQNAARRSFEIICSHQPPTRILCFHKRIADGAELVCFDSLTARAHAIKAMRHGRISQVYTYRWMSRYRGTRRARSCSTLAEA